MSWVHRIIIVPVAFQTLAKQLATGVAPEDSAKGLVTVPLSATGNLPATHYISCGYIRDDFAALLGDASATNTAAKGAAPLASIQAMYAAATIVGPDANGTPADPAAVIASLNLQPIKGAIG